MTATKEKEPLIVAGSTASTSTQRQRISYDAVTFVSNGNSEVRKFRNSEIQKLESERFKNSEIQ